MASLLREKPDATVSTKSWELQFTVGSMSGRWTGVMNGSPVQFQLTQSAERVEGRWQVNAIPGEGRLEPGSSFITDRGRVTMRIEHSFFIDATVNGQMESSGVRIVGTLTGSGFNGLPITLTKQQ